MTLTLQKSAPAKRTDLRPLAANAITYLFLIAAAVLTLAPFLMSLMTSLKSPKQFATTPTLSLPSPVTFENYQSLFTGSINFLVPIVVTIQVVLVLVIGQLVGSVLAAYAFAMLDFPGRNALFWVYLSTMMVPPIVTAIPLFMMVSEVGLRDTFAGIVVPFMFASPYAIFLLRENFRSVPTQLLDAAKLDGAGPMRTLWSVVLPMNRPILATLLLITVVTQWNDFLWPKTITTSQTWQVMTVATTYLQSQYENNWTLVMAATTVAMLPLVLLFIIFQRQIVRSIGITGSR